VASATNIRLVSILLSKRQRQRIPAASTRPPIVFFSTLSLLIDLLMLRITLVQVQWHSPEKFIRYPSGSIHMLSSIVGITDRITSDDPIFQKR
jgi:hypothetical protein